MDVEMIQFTQDISPFSRKTVPDSKSEILNRLSAHRQRLNDISQILMSHSSTHKRIVLQEIQYYQEGVYMLLHGLNSSAEEDQRVNDEEVRRAVSSLKDDALEVLHWLDSLKMC
jgi:hypothetical protein